MIHLKRESKTDSTKYKRLGRVLTEPTNINNYICQKEKHHIQSLGFFEPRAFTSGQENVAGKAMSNLVGLVTSMGSISSSDLKQHGLNETIIVYTEMYLHNKSVQI